MPTIFRFDGFRFFFYSNEGSEPPHLHISNGEGELKVWLENLEVEYNFNFSASQKKIVLKIMKNNRQRFLRDWYKFYE